MKSIIIHYAHESNEYADNGICNTYSDNLESKWEFVSCKKCLRLRTKFEIEFERDEQICIKQMGEIIDFYNNKYNAK